MESLLSVIRSLKGSRVRAEHLQHASAPATSLSPPLSLCSIPFSLHRAASVRETRALCSGSVLFPVYGIVPLERCTMRTPQSSRLFTHRRRSIPCIAFCFQTRAPPPERGGGGRSSCGWKGRKEGGAKVHFTRTLDSFVTFSRLVFDRERKDRGFDFFFDSLKERKEEAPRRLDLFSRRHVFVIKRNTCSFNNQSKNENGTEERLTK